MLNILPCPLLATRVKGGSSDHQIVVIPTGTRCYNFDTVLQEKVGTIYDHPTTQYEQFIERYYGRHKGSGKSKACNDDLRRTIILQRCGVWGGGGGSNLMSQLRYFGKNSLETPPKLHKPFYTSTLQLPIPNVVTKTQLLSLVQ